MAGVILFQCLFVALQLSFWSGCDDGGGDAGADGDSDADTDGDGDGDADGDGDGDADGDGDGDADGDGDGDADGDVDEGCGSADECQRDSECSEGTLCAGGRCEAAIWETPSSCSTDWDRCVSGAFPDPCYERDATAECSHRAEELRPPRCFSFLELGAPGPGDDAHVLRLLHDLWSRGQADAMPSRPKVVLALGDSISESMAYITSSSFDCRLPDFSFPDGYRLAGQPGTWAVPQTAMSGQTASWGVEVLSTTSWYEQVRPEVATVMFGTNELWSWWEGIEQYVENMRSIVDELLSHNVIPILMTIPPGTYQMQSDREICGTFCTLTTNYETEQFAQAVRDLAAERLLPLVDLHRRFMDFDRPGFEALLADGVHPCLDEDCPSGAVPGGTHLRDDALLRMYKYLEARAMTRCPGTSPPPAPAGYSWNDADVLSSFRGADPVSYCPDPHVSCP